MEYVSSEAGNVKRICVSAAAGQCVAVITTPAFLLTADQRGEICLSACLSVCPWWREEQGSLESPEFGHTRGS